MDMDVKFNDAKVQQGLKNLIRIGTDLSPVMRTIANTLVDAAEDAFEYEASPEGEHWANLYPETIAARTKSGHVPIKILQRSGHLVRSILSDWSPTEAVAGTNAIYAATHQFGDEERGIEARPFLGVGPQHAESIQDSVMAFIAEQWQ